MQESLEGTLGTGQSTGCGSLSPLCGAVLQTVWDQAGTQFMWASMLVLVAENLPKSLAVLICFLCLVSGVSKLSAHFSRWSLAFLQLSC